MKILNEKKLQKKITKSVEKDLEKQNIGGAEIIVNQNGERIFHEVFGMKNETEKLDFGATYRLASMTKPITCVGVLKEVERGHIDLEEDVSFYIPKYEHTHFDIKTIVDGKIVDKGKNTKPIKVWYLLSHTSGIGSDVLGCQIFDGMAPENKQTLDTVVDYFASQPLAFEPFTWERYSPSAAFDVAAKIVEQTSGMSYDKFLKENIFDKLKMKDTNFAPNDDQWDRMVSVFKKDSDGKGTFTPKDRKHVFGDFPTTYFCAGGGLSSTAEDYSLFAEMLLNKGKTKDGEQIIDSKYIEKLSSPLVPDSVMKQEFIRWGLGVRVITSKKYVLPVSSYGWSGAYGTHFWVDPVNNITAIYMKNATYDGGAGAETAKKFEEDVMHSF